MSLTKSMVKQMLALPHSGTPLSKEKEGTGTHISLNDSPENDARGIIASLRRSHNTWFHLMITVLKQQNWRRVEQINDHWVRSNKWKQRAMGVHANGEDEGCYRGINGMSLLHH